ncbi:MAG: alpha-2-macroglobulin [Vicinamibacterales bacterium]
MSLARALALLVVAMLLVRPAPATAQDDAAVPSGPAFSLSSSETFTSRDRAEIWLTFRQVSSLDFRIYKVRDPIAFLSALRDPHQFGTDQPAPVPQEPTLLERIATWKAAQRRRVRDFVRAQTTVEYRQARRAADDTTRVSRRVQLQVNTFAQVPLLNPEQLVSSWRELLPNYRDAEVRRLPLDLSERGMYVVEAVHDRLRAFTVVVISDVGVVAKASPGQMLLFAADRHSGEPRGGCEARVVAGGAAVAAGRTAADGLVDAAVPDDTRAALGIVACGDDVGVADPGGWVFGQASRELAAFVYTDKPIYRPGHTVHAKAVLRWRHRDALSAFDRPDVEVRVTDAIGGVILRQRAPVDEFGGVAVDVPLGAGAALGLYGISVLSGDAEASGMFEVQEYRRPEYEVLVTVADRFVVQGREVVADVQARYYFGQPVANAAVHYVVEKQPYYSPLRWSDDADPEEDGGWYGGDLRTEGDLTLGADGRGQIRLPLEPDADGRDYRARIEARVTDASGREVTGAGVVQATFGSFLVSARLDQYMARPGGSVVLTARTVDYPGTARADVPVRVLVERLQYADGYYSAPTVTLVAETEARTDADGQLATTVAVPTVPGSYRVAVVAREGDRDLRDDAWLWVPGPGDAPADGDSEYLELLADKRTYAPGDTARVVVRGRDVVGPVLLTKEGQHVSWHQVVRPTVAGAFEIPVTAGDIGDVYVHVTLLRDGKLLQAERRLTVPPVSRTLQIALTADRPVARPQEPATFAVQVTDAEGRPARASVSLAVIDESVYGVKADTTPDPARVFYRREYSRVGTAFSRHYHFTGFSGTDRLRLAARRRRPLSLADFKADRLAQPQVRKEFPDAIHWVASLVTDAEGRGRVTVRYPDSLTTWRLTARAVTTDTKVGAAVARTTTTKDLIVRLVTPRFLTEGDTIATPTIVHNYRDEAREARVQVSATGVSASGATAPVSSAVAANGERRDPWSYTAGAPGRAVFTATASAGGDRDALELTVPIVPYGVRREVSATGSLAGAGDTTRSLVVPDAANPAARTIRVALAPSMAGALLGAADQLTSFPYGCTEQTLSSFIPNLVVTRALTDLQLAPTERLSMLGRQVTDGLRRLYDLQHDDGGWGWWASDGNHPFMTAYALSGLVDAEAHGYRVDGGRRERAVQMLASMVLDYPRAEPELKTYMVWVLGRALGGRATLDVYRDGEARTYTQRAALDEVWNARDRMSSYGHALLVLALAGVDDRRADEAVGLLAAAVQREGALAHWASDRDPLLVDGGDTSVEATAWAVRALAARTPDSPLLEPAVRWLILNRQAGWWATTKQTALALDGVLAYMRARRDTGAVGTVEVVVNGATVGTHTFTRESLVASTPITITAPAVGGANSVRLVSRGTGTVHWTATAEYFDPTAAQHRRGSSDLAITRSYARLESIRQNGRLVYREVPITGPLQTGDVVAVRLAVAGGGDWRYLLLEDPIPAGTEAVTRRDSYPLARETPWARLSHEEYRDERSAFFLEALERGRADVLYLLKVVSDGTFRASPARVTPMYVPDVHASSEPFTVQVATAPGGGGR